MLLSLIEPSNPIEGGIGKINVGRASIDDKRNKFWPHFSSTSITKCVEKDSLFLNYYLVYCIFLTNEMMAVTAGGSSNQHSQLLRYYRNYCVTEKRKKVAFITHAGGHCCHLVHLSFFVLNCLLNNCRRRPMPCCFSLLPAVTNFSLTLTFIRTRRALRFSSLLFHHKRLYITCII